MEDQRDHMASKDTPKTTIKGAESLHKHLPRPVKLVLFTKKDGPGCEEQRHVLEAVTTLSTRLSLEVFDLNDEPEKARLYRVDKTPATVVIGERDYGLRFYGVSTGYEFASLIEALLMSSSGQPSLAPELETWAKRIKTPTHIEVLVTLTCPYCPQMVHLAYQLAIANRNIRADVVEASLFQDLARKYDLEGVPLVVVNGRRAFESLLPPMEALLEILKIAEPGVFEELEAKLRSETGHRHVRPLKPGHVYDTIVVGAGPAAMAAAIYAIRKGLDVALVGDRLGGQISDTASIENWLGLPQVGDLDLATMFRAHVENYELAQRLHTRVASVEADGDTFRVRTEEGEEFRAFTVIYCAGKQYRTLGVPGETSFLGRGIAFCATCDAPLYGGKRVAVVGGGNSAFSAARDLLPYAKEIHLVNIVPDWQADAVLQKEVTGQPRVKLHPSTRVVEFLGGERLTGVRLIPVGGKDFEELPVDGVFLEIGLVPNSGPVAKLVPLSSQGEILVNRDQSTAVPGFFAAGDVTDEPEKQIVVAEGAGAKAGLAAYNYLMSKGRHPQGHPTEVAAW